MSGPFKMKGSPAKLGSIQGTAGHASALKQMSTKQLESVDVSGGDKTKSVREEYEAMKKAPGSPPDKLATEYGGTWSKKGDRNAWTNEQGQTAKQAALAKNREKKGKKAKYMEENKTSDGMPWVEAAAGMAASLMGGEKKETPKKEKTEKSSLNVTNPGKYASPAKQVEEKKKVKKKKSNISTTKGSSIITNTDTGDTYNLKTGETTKNKRGRQKQQRKERARARE